MPGPEPPRSADPLLPPLRLARVLRERHRQEGSWAALQRAISEAAGNPRGKRAGAHILDRRKLSDLASGQDVSLTLAELAALDRYLEPIGEGLAFQPFFEKHNLVDLLTETGRVTLLLGAKRQGEFWYVSHWDALALAEIQRELSNAPTRARVDIRDVPVFDDVRSTRQSIQSPEWKQLLGDDGPSLVCIGSPRASAAAEPILCAMFGIDEPYPQEEHTDRTLPFHFVWNPEVLPNVFPSRFHWRHEAIAPLDIDVAKEVERGDASAIALDGELMVDRLRSTEAGPTYGICAVQRRRSGKLFVVLAGITGVATLVAAKLVKRTVTRLYEEPRGRHSRVHWAVIGARVDPDPQVPFASLREFPDEAFYTSFAVWPPEEAEEDGSRR